MGRDAPLFGAVANPTAAMTTGDFALGMIAAAIWGATYVVTAAALDRVPPILFVVMRFSAAAIPAFFIPRPRMPWQTVVLAGLLLGAGQYGFLFFAMANGVPPGVAAVLFHTQAIIMVVLGAVLFSERIGRHQVLALALALAGLIVLAFARDSAKTVTALFLALAAALCGAAGNLLLRRIRSSDPLGLAVWMNTIPPLPLLALSYWLEGPEAIAASFETVDLLVISAVLYSALLATVAAFAVWGRLLGRYPVAKTAPFFLMVPVIALGSSALLLGETMSLGKIIGAGLILASLPVVQRQ